MLLSALLAAAAVAAGDCATGAPVTTSPTGSRLWSAVAARTAPATPHELHDDGSIHFKAPWYASGPRRNPEAGPRGRLVVTGSRVDGEAPPLRARATPISVPTFTGTGAWAVVLIFPREGCWRVTGRVERTTFTFRLLVQLGA